MSREQSAIVKGIAILLMMIHHLPKIPGLMDAENPIMGVLQSLSHPIQYFLIVSGYGLYCAFMQGRLSLRYLLKRSARLYLSFWLVLLIFVFGIGSWLYPGRFSTQPAIVIANLVGWRWDYCQFTWFLLPYVLMTFCSRTVFWAIERLGNWISLGIGLFLYLIATWLISRYYVAFLSSHLVLYHCVLVMQTLFALTIGAVMARVTLSGHKLTWKSLQGRNWLIFGLILAAFMVRSQIRFSVVPFFAAIIVWLALHADSSALLNRVLAPLGRKSMMMWFLHGYLAVYMFSEYIIHLRYPILIYLVWVALSYVLASMLLPISNKIARILRLY